MPKEKSAGAIIFRKENNKIKYLLLEYKYKTHYWDFPRGNIEKNEKPLDTAKREISEETGITELNFIKGFEKKINWFYKRDEQTIFKEVIYFLAETKQEEVKISWENLGHAWLRYDEALKKLNKKSKEVLIAAKEFLDNYLKQKKLTNL